MSIVYLQGGSEPRKSVVNVRQKPQELNRGQPGSVQAFPVGDPNGPYPAPYATVYRSMAVIGVSGFGSLPKNSGYLMCVFFVGAILFCLAKDLLPSRVSWYIPIPAAAAIAFYVGPAVAIDMTIGSVMKVCPTAKYDSEVPFN
jgi:uncharacterized oligopeptide transporter (OPT) family protein